MRLSSEKEVEAVPLVLPNTYTENVRIKSASGNLKAFVGAAILVLVFTTLRLVLSSFSVFDHSPNESLLVRTANGSYRGLHLKSYDQIVHLGMPYASPPIGKFRFRHPHPFQETWAGTRNATSYSPHCHSYGGEETHFVHSEDCLTINVIRPVSAKKYPLPVAVYIYGGLNSGGGSSDGRYNMSFIVAAASKAGLPFIGVSFNYRASIWGFIDSRQIQGAGLTNIGLHDQRMALKWVQENIAAFGGDPGKVTIWGGSSGADDVGYHLLAYSGRDDGLFRAAIMQSGTPVARTSYSVPGLQNMYDGIVNKTECGQSEDSIECLRKLPYENLSKVFVDYLDGTSPKVFTFSLASIDGSFIPTYGSLSLKNKQFVRVPIISGIVANEGSNWIPGSVGVFADMRRHLIDDRNFPLAVADRLMSLYPEREKGDGDELRPPLKSITSFAELKRIESLLGDIETNAADRLQCEAYASSSSCYSFRFDANVATGLDPRLGVTHGSEIGPVFQNYDGLGFRTNPFAKKGEGFRHMSLLMGIMWASFIVYLDPNVGLAANGLSWPSYSVDRREKIIFNDTGAWVEQDFSRVEAIAYINSIQHGVLER